MFHLGPTLSPLLSILTTDNSRVPEAPNYGTMIEDSGAYRQRQIDSVSDLTGTTMKELILVTLPLPIGLWLLSEFQVGFCGNKPEASRKRNDTCPAIIM